MSDETAIRALVVELALRADDGTMEEYLALFTDDATWEVGANDAAGVPGDSRRGRADIAESVRQRRELGIQGPGSGSMHHVTTHHVTVDGDDAAGRAYYQFVAMVTGRPVVQTIGQYHDRYRRTGGVWRLAHRTVAIS